MKIGVIGTGISGMLVAYLLHHDHEVTVFEANDYIGGHTHTIHVPMDGQSYAVDTGFIVFNDWTYPNFIKLLTRLGVASQPSRMSFSVSCAKTGLEYNGTSIRTLFAQRRNLVRPSFYRMILDILRFNRESLRLLQNSHAGMTLGQYLETNRYSKPFLEHYILPMGAAIWSTTPQQILEFPARSFVQFFANHGMLSINRRPQWRVIQGGSCRYVEALTRPYRDRIRLKCAVRSVVRYDDRVEVGGHSGPTERFDRVVIATHSDQALSLLQNPTQKEREILSAIPYQENAAILHTDSSVLPRRRRAWASWNYHIPREPRERIAVTYNMNILQGIRAPHQFCVTLNYHAAIDPQKIVARMVYHHPVYTRDALAAQRRHAEINGANRTYFCGAYWGYGFHEDGINSALAVCKHFGKSL